MSNELTIYLYMYFTLVLFHGFSLIWSKVRARFLNGFSPFQVTAMKATHNQMTSEQQKHKEQIARQSFELSTAR